jgi:hypothetical protein
MRITQAAPVEQSLLALGEPPRPPPIGSACRPPAWDDAPEPDWDALQQPERDFPFDRRVAWQPPSLPQATVRPTSSPGGALR